MRIIPLLAAAALVWSLPASAHPRLLSATPAPDTPTTPTARLELVFSEKLVRQFSGANIVMTSMPGMKMSGPTPMAVTANVAEDGKTLVVISARPLPKGSYRVEWHVVSNDTHRVSGSYGFRIQ